MLGWPINKNDLGEDPAPVPPEKPAKMTGSHMSARIAKYETITKTPIVHAAELFLAEATSMIILHRSLHQHSSYSCVGSPTARAATRNTPRRTTSITSRRTWKQYCALLCSPWRNEKTTRSSSCAEPHGESCLAAAVDRVNRVAAWQAGACRHPMNHGSNL